MVKVLGGLGIATGANDTVLTSDSTQASGVKWATAVSGYPPKELNFPAESMSCLETAFAPLVKITGTNQRIFVRAFDTTTEEYVNGKFMVPVNLDETGTVTFYAYVYASTAAASKNIGLTFGHYAAANSETFDGTYTEEDTGAVAIDATQGDLTYVTWTETVSNLGWAASDAVFFRLSRDTSVANNLATDMYLTHFRIVIPQAP